MQWNLLSVGFPFSWNQKWGCVCVNIVILKQYFKRKVPGNVGYNFKREQQMLCLPVEEARWLSWRRYAGVHTGRDVCSNTAVLSQDLEGILKLFCRVSQHWNLVNWLPMYLDYEVIQPAWWEWVRISGPYCIIGQSQIPVKDEKKTLWGILNVSKAVVILIHRHFALTFEF